MGLMNVSFRVQRTLPSTKDVLMMEVAHFVVISLAALMNYSGQGSRDVVVALVIKHYCKLSLK